MLSPYLNYHRPCLFATEQRDARGRIRKRYRDHDIATPYEKLNSLPEAVRWLKPGVSFETLDATACTQSDLDAALAVNAAREELFRALGARVELRRVVVPVTREPIALWICGRVLRTGASPAGRVDSPWTTLARCPPPAHTLAPLAHELHRAHHKSSGRKHHTATTLCLTSPAPATHTALSHNHPDIAPPAADSPSSFRLISGLENALIASLALTSHRQRRRGGARLDDRPRAGTHEPDRQISLFPPSGRGFPGLRPRANWIAPWVK